MKIVLKSILFANFILFSTAAYSQIGAGGISMFGEIAPKWHLGVTAEVSTDTALKSDVSGLLGGRMASFGSDANIKFQGAYDNRHFLTASVNYGYRNYDFSSTESNFENTNRVSAFVFYTTKFNERWGMFALTNISFGAAFGESLWDGKTFMGGFGATYAINQNINIGFGGIAYSRVDNTWLGLPIAYIDWKITEQLKLRTFTGAALFYDVFNDDTLVLSAAFEYKNSYYRTSPQILPSGESVRRSSSDSYMQVGLGATYRFIANAYVSGFVGTDFSRSINFRSNGNSLGDADVDATPVFSLKLGYNF